MSFVENALLIEILSKIILLTYHLISCNIIIRFEEKKWDIKWDIKIIA